MVAIGWFCNRSRGSILVAGIAYAGGNTALAFLPNLDWQVYNVTVLAAVVVMIVVHRM